MNDQLADARRRGRRPIRTGTNRVGRSRPGELDQLGGAGGHLHQAVGKTLLESELTQQPNHRPKTVPELLEHERHRVRALAENEKCGRLLDRDEAEIAEAGSNRPPGPDRKRQPGRVDGDGCRLERRVRSRRPAFTGDVDRLELLSAPTVAGHVAARLGPNVARVSIADPHSPRVTGVLTLHAADAQDAGQALQPAGAESGQPAETADTARPTGKPGIARVAAKAGPRLTAEAAAEAAVVVHAVIVAKTVYLVGPDAAPDPGRPTPCNLLASLRKLLYGSGMLEVGDMEIVRQRSAAVARALGDAKRLCVLQSLADGELSVHELSDRVGCHVPNMSQHLAVLRNSGLVLTRRDGNAIYYRLADPRILEACRLLQSIAG
ncbi:MAG: ArsR/SmtB family transcription factor [Candidatus Limnocylindrales bacterium]